MAKSLHEVKIDERKQNKPNLITDSDYFLRDKEKEKEMGYPNTIDITGMTTSSQEEANDVKVKSLQKQLEDMTKALASLKQEEKQLEDMTKALASLKQEASEETEKTNTKKGNSNKNKKDETVNDTVNTNTVLGGDNSSTDSSAGISGGEGL